MSGRAATVAPVAFEDAYPEHAKLDGVKERSQACGEFLEHLSERGLVLGRYHEHSDGCMGPHGPKTCSWDLTECGHDPEDRVPTCGFGDEAFHPAPYSVNDLLAEFFGVDLKKLEAEKLRMLDEIRGAPRKGPA